MKQTLRQRSALKLLPVRSFGSIGKKPPKVRSFGIIPKRLGERLQAKDAHLHSEAHLAVVRHQRCVVTGKTYDRVMHGGRQWLSSVIAHHPDELFPANVCAGRRCSDYLAVPLLAHLHDDFPDSLHKHGGSAWWNDKPDPYAWLREFLTRHYPADHEGAAYALHLIEERRT